ncbi:ESS1 [Symbiodinium pilosum]|uniref:peptidylprolyl isomerase n=1 Tax=Symbiodinium pilosum TaxID=2952 RepID=A0A812JIL8_SYMPI|nr:ESS1 [Symbiodinium pilosum]
MDVYVTQILAELHYLIDEEGGIPSPKRAAALLGEPGVEAGCGEVAAQAGIDRRYRALLTQLAAVSPNHSRRAFRVLAELADAAARPPTTSLWIPSGDRSVSVSRALGFRDLKRQRPLVGLELSAEIVRLKDGPQFLTILSDGARGLSQQRLAQVAAVHFCRPKAASMRIASDAASSAPGEAVGVLTVALQVGAETEGTAADAKGPEAKKRKVEHVTPGGKRKVRVASLLLKYAGVSEADSYARRKPPASRSQADAEKELLQVLEALNQDPKPGEAKDLGLRFAAKCEKLSDCKSATNKPHADLGWVLEGQFGKDFDAVAFDLDVGGLSDIFTTTRGVQIMYRLA